MVRREGFEPPYSMRADLQSAAFNQLRYRRIIISEYCIIPTMLNISMVNVKGLEPFFYSLQVNAKCMATGAFNQLSYQRPFYWRGLMPIYLK